MQKHVELNGLRKDTSPPPSNQVFCRRTCSDIDILPQLFPHLSSPADRPDCLPQPFPAKPGGPLPVPLPEGEEEMFSHLQKSEITTNVSKLLFLLPSLALGQGGPGVLLSAAEPRREGDGRSHTAGEGGGWVEWMEEGFFPGGWYRIYQYQQQNVVVEKCSR